MPRSPHRDRRTIARFAGALLLAGAAVYGCSARAPISEPDARAVGTRSAIRDLRPGQLRVCAFGFNSPHELDEIRPHLPADRFEFTDLTPVFPNASPAGLPPGSSTSALGQSRPGWLIDQCRSDVQCDILIYSGEFAGGFFGDQGISVTLQEMEEASCLSRCAGVFHHPREVFLLGCNTLATKSADSRTPDQYLEVLLEHGFNRIDAERAVDLRYGPLGPSFRESLRRIFAGVPRIYGFSTVAPRGEKTAPRLRRYFKQQGDYAAYLERTGRDTAPNKPLLTAFSGMGLIQTSGLEPSEAAAGDRGLVCSLYDESQPVEQRLHVVQQMMMRQDVLAFVPTVAVFLDRHPPEQFDAGERRAFDDVRSLSAPRKQVLELTKRLKTSAQKSQMATLSRTLGWMTPAEYDQLAAESVRQLLAEPMSTDVADIGCELSRQTPVGKNLQSDEIPEQLFWHAEGYRWLDCLSPADPRVSARMLTGLDNIDETTRLWALYALARRAPLDDSVLIALSKRVNDRSPGVRDRVRAILTAAAPLSPQVLRAVRERDPSFAKSLEERAVAKETERTDTARRSKAPPRSAWNR